MRSSPHPTPADEETGPRASEHPPRSPSHRYGTAGPRGGARTARRLPLRPLRRRAPPRRRADPLRALRQTPHGPLDGTNPLAPAGGGARDPFLVRAADGSGFRLLATDLRIHGGEDWERAIAHGSRDLLVWSSADLRGWDGAHRVEVMPEQAGCVWAPEAVYDPGREEYLVFWASTVYPDDDPRHESPSYQRMYCATTKDFRTFGDSRVGVDKGSPVIDSTVVEDDGWFYRFTKDERLPGTPDAPDAKFVFVERSRDLWATDYEPVAQGVGRGTDAPRGLAHAERSEEDT